MKRHCNITTNKISDCLYFRRTSSKITSKPMKTILWEAPSYGCNLPQCKRLHTLNSNYQFIYHFLFSSKIVKTLSPLGLEPRTSHKPSQTLYHMSQVNLTTFIFSLSSKLEEKNAATINPHSDQGSIRRAAGEYEVILNVHGYETI